jgi:hypothetical protein
MARHDTARHDTIVCNTLSYHHTKITNITEDTVLSSTRLRIVICETDSLIWQNFEVKWTKFWSNKKLWMSRRNLHFVFTFYIKTISWLQTGTVKLSLSLTVGAHGVVRRPGSAHRRQWGCQSYAPAPSAPRKIPGRYIFLLEAECGWKA